MQLGESRGLSAAGGASFEKNPVRHFAGTAQPLLIRKAVVPPESADCSALLADESKRGVRANCVPKLFELPVNSVFSQEGIEGEGIEEDINVFREPLDQVPALREACAAFEDNLASSR